MNRQRFLAELSRLLVFMTEEDREETIRRYSAMFDDVGPGGEAALIEQLGSPTKAAIGLSRGYEPGEVHILPPIVMPRRPRAEDSVGRDGLPEFRLPGLDDEEEESGEDGILVPPAPAAENDRPRKAAMPRPVVAEEEDDLWEETEVPARTGTKVVRTMPLWLGIPLFLLVFIALGLPVAAVVLALMAVLLAPGCALLFGAYLVFVGGLWCTAYMADAILLFGAALVVLALGLLILWCGIWLDVKLATAYVRGVGWVAGETLGRKVTADE